jgi:hypothetical protein
MMRLYASGGLLEMSRHPSVIDRHVAARLRVARLEAGKGQTQVAIRAENAPAAFASAARGPPS